MITEEMLLETWRTLDSSKQEQVIQFMELLKQTKTLEKPPSNLSPSQQAQRWEEWAKSHQKRGFSLPDEALHRDSMYED
jgi:hypothetical protein